MDTWKVRKWGEINLLFFFLSNFSSFHGLYFSSSGSGQCGPCACHVSGLQMPYVSHCWWTHFLGYMSLPQQAMEASKYSIRLGTLYIKGNGRSRTAPVQDSTAYSNYSYEHIICIPWPTTLKIMWPTCYGFHVRLSNWLGPRWLSRLSFHQLLS